MKRKSPLLLALIVLSSAVVPISAAPVSAVVDPVNAQQPPSAEVQSTTAEELKTKVVKNQVTVIDVRSTEAYANSVQKIKGAIHVKLRRLKYRLDFEPLKSVSKDSEVVTYCSCPNDEASIAAARILMDAGFKRVRFLKGGWREWQKLGGPVESLPRT